MISASTLADSLGVRGRAGSSKSTANNPNFSLKINGLFCKDRPAKYESFVN